MDLTNLISVFVPTHIVRADYDPFIKNEMIVETIKQTHEKLNLGDVEFFIYPDARFKKSHPRLMEQYYEYLDSIEKMPGFENININVISTSEIKLSVLIEMKYLELAVRSLHDAFDLQDM